MLGGKDSLSCLALLLYISSRLSSRKKEQSLRSPKPTSTSASHGNALAVRYKDEKKNMPTKKYYATGDGEANPT